MSGTVRGTLYLHAQARLGASLDEPAPNDLAPAAPLREQLDAFDDERLREAARDYARLWARTFRNLVRHLRGRPEDALAMFVGEVYPFLCGERRGARLEAQDRGHARVSLAGVLPRAYLAGLIEGFVALSGAEVHATARSDEVFDVRWHVAPTDRLARAFLTITDLRVPFMLAVLVATAIGVGGAWHHGPEMMRVSVVAFGVLAVQAGANAWHDLRGRRDHGPFHTAKLPSWLLRITISAGYVAGAVAAAWLVATGTPTVALWVAAGLGLSLLYALIEDHGTAPFLAGLTYGPLVATGTLHALVGWVDVTTYLDVILASLPLGALAAATVYVNDLADRPLDAAAGRRTLVVRLPRPGHVIGYAVLVGTGAVGTVVAAWWHLGRVGAVAAVVAIPVWVLIRLVHRHVDDPHGLAPARLWTLTLHLILGATLAAILFWSPT